MRKESSLNWLHHLLQTQLHSHAPFTVVAGHTHTFSKKNKKT